MVTLTRRERVEGLLYGGAFGDAWGKPVEFKDFETITRIIRRNGGEVPMPNQLVITDDTQMHLYTMDAVRQMLDTGLIPTVHTESDVNAVLHDVTIHESVRDVIARHYVRFYFDPMNNRAPGSTVMKALEAKVDRKISMDAIADNNSLGCGTVMRAPWLGALDMPRETIAALSALSAQVTHGDPVGWVISAVSSDLVYRIMEGRVVAPGIDNDPLSEMYDPNWLFWEALTSLEFLAALDSPLFPDEAVHRVRNEINDIINSDKMEVIHATGVSTDVCSLFGGAWIANEALYGSIAVASSYAADSAYDGVHRLVATSGDSDSLASIGGALLGALYGYESLEADVKTLLEPHYKPLMADLLDFLVG